MRIGLLGGTFNPIHRAHVAIARAARDQLGLDRVLLVPSARPPHKDAASVELAPFDDRLAMVKLAIAGEPKLEASDIESRRDGPSYTVDTVAEILRESPDSELFLIIGSDTVGELAKWHDAERLRASVRLAIAMRPDHGEFKLDRTVSVLTGERDRASSSAIRERVRRGGTIDGLVPDAVRDYIRSHGLYRATKPEKKGSR